MWCIQSYLSVYRTYFSRLLYLAACIAEACERLYFYIVLCSSYIHYHACLLLCIWLWCLFIAVTDANSYILCHCATVTIIFVLSWITHSCTHAVLCCIVLWVCVLLLLRWQFPCRINKAPTWTWTCTFFFFFLSLASEWNDLNDSLSHWFVHAGIHSLSHWVVYPLRTNQLLASVTLAEGQRRCVFTESSAEINVLFQEVTHFGSCCPFVHSKKIQGFLFYGCWATTLHLGKRESDCLMLVTVRRLVAADKAQFTV